MKIKLTKDHIPDYPEDKVEPIEVEGGVEIRLGMEYDDDGWHLEDYGKPVSGKSPDVLWDELLEALEGEVEDQFCHGISNEATVDDTDFDFSYWSGDAPGMFIDSTGYGREYYYLPMKGSNAETDDEQYGIAEKRKWLHADARTIRGAWRGDWWGIYCTAKVYVAGMELGSAGFGADSTYEDSDLLEVYGEALAEALVEAKREWASLAKRLAGGNPLTELEVE